jgi:hypothetical protein
MISKRTLTLSCAFLFAVPVVVAKDVKPARAGLIFLAPSLIQELPLQSQRAFGVSLQAAPVVAPPTDAQDPGRYREYQLGMSLPTVAKLAGLDASEAKVIHQRPALIQELEWEPSRSMEPSPKADSVSELLFSFYNGELFRMVVNYDRYKTEGLTDDDMVEAISAKYGTASRPDAKVVLFSSFQVYNDSEKVIARWEDAQYSFNLFRSSYQPTFGMLIFSKRLDPLAQASIAEAIRLDEQEAPQHEIERQKERDAKDRAEQEKARLANKPDFRP